MATSITCPSTFTFSARKFKGQEANLFMDRKLVREGGLIGAILKAVCLDVVDPGPYALGHDGRPAWEGMLSGDRLIALIDARVGTYGPGMEFKVQCESHGCRRVWIEDVDLTTDFERKPLSTESFTTFKNGDLFTTTFMDNDGAERLLKFHLMTGKDEAALMRVAKNNKGSQATASLLQRIDEIDGVHRNDMLRFLNDLDLDLTSDLIERLDDHDCGIKTEIESECPECGNAQEITVPLGGKEFFLPKRRSTKTGS